MLEKVRNYFIKDIEIDLTLKNKLRFESIHLDTRFNSLTEVYQRLIENDQSLSNDEILERYYQFSKKIQTNSFAAAELELVSISTLCYFRRELTPVLIRAGLLAIIYSLGDSINFDDVINFINYRILGKSAEPYGGLPQEEGIKWLNEILPRDRYAIEKILVDVINKSKEELESI